MSVDFVQKITDEKKKLRELTFNVYTTSCFDEKTNIGSYSFCVIDRYEKKTTIVEQVNSTTKSEIELKPILESVKYIMKVTPPNFKQYICINLCSTSLYSVNIIREWLSKWIEEDTGAPSPATQSFVKFSQRPNHEILKEINNLISVIKFNIKWVQKSTNEIIWSIDRKTNEKLFE